MLHIYIFPSIPLLYIALNIMSGRKEQHATDMWQLVNGVHPATCYLF